MSTASAGDAPHSSGSTSTTGGTSAITRSWSDVDPVRLLATFGLTSFAYSVLGQPLFLAIARQQCSPSPLSARQVLMEVRALHGFRGFYRGAGAAITGTVLSELVYYSVVEYCREKLPLRDRESRVFAAGLLADALSAPIFNPFAVVSQVQMVAGCSFSTELNYMSARRTTLTLVKERGMSCLFRGTLLTLLVSPLTGAWWLLYEYIKAGAYNVGLPRLAGKIGQLVPAAHRMMPKLPTSCTSSTDNVIVNAMVGATASMVMGVLMNPIYVLRLRLQVHPTQPGVRFPALHIVRQVLHNEGPRAFWKGLGGNLFVAVLGGCAFGITYEGTKQLSDISEVTAT